MESSTPSNTLENPEQDPTGSGGPGSSIPRLQVPVRILLCDHRGRGLAGELTGLSQANYALETTTSLRQTLTRLTDLETQRPDALLLLGATQSSRVELAALERGRSAAGAPSPIPLLVLTPPEDQRATLRVDQILVAGAWDAVQEGTGPEEIALRLRRLIEGTRRELEMDELRHLASHDDRTDLLRPKTFQARLDEHFSAAKRHKYEMALVLIDLDRFGQINKVHDHTVGDDLITRVGEAIRSALRIEDAAGQLEDSERVNGDDAAGRLGGDEFAVILPYTEKIHAAGVVKRLLTAIKELSGTPRGAKGHIDVSASIGFETFNGTDLDTLMTMRQHAERSLRAAKERGGDQGVYFRSLKD